MDFYLLSNSTCIRYFREKLIKLLHDNFTMYRKAHFFLFFSLLLIVACDSSSEKSASQSLPELQPSPQPNADSLYAFVKKQVNFGPRVPNSEAHENTANWFVKTFEQYGGRVSVQKFETQVYDGTRVTLKNIIVAFQPEVKKRILLAAHWDTRPFADKDENDSYAPFQGANDGGSGVAVLLEVARIMALQKKPTVGVDIILFDGEDWGEHKDEEMVDLPVGLDSWYCLGSQHWSKNKHQANYSAYYGILLDMVGAPDATFYYDGISEQNAGRVLDRTWNIAHQLGYQKYFKKAPGPQDLTDDHKYVNRDARIPMINVIDYKEDTYFGTYHHTQVDNLDNISPETLAAVAKVVLAVLYNE